MLKSISHDAVKLVLKSVSHGAVKLVRKSVSHDTVKFVRKSVSHDTVKLVRKSVSHDAVKLVLVRNVMLIRRQTCHTDKHARTLKSTCSRACDARQCH